jgi:hypothetical protein
MSNPTSSTSGAGSTIKAPQPPAKKDPQKNLEKQPMGPDLAAANPKPNTPPLNKISAPTEKSPNPPAGEAAPVKAPSAQNTPPVKTVVPPGGQPVQPKAATQPNQETQTRSAGSPIAQETASAIKARSTLNLRTPGENSPSGAPSSLPTASPASAALAKATESAPRSQPVSDRPAAGNASNSSGSAGNSDYTPEADARRVTDANPALTTGQVQQGIKMGIPSSEVAKMSPAQLGTAIRAMNLGLNYSASEADVTRTSLNLTQLNPNSDTGRADIAARTGVNTELAKQEYAAALKDGKVRTLATGEKMTASEEAAFRLRIDTKGMTPDQVKLAVSQKVAQVNGLTLPANATQEQISRANMTQSMRWLASQPNSGITVSGSDPNFENATYKQMLDGYKKVYNMSADASWADVMQEWQIRNATRANAAGLNETSQAFYERTSGLTAYRAANPPARGGGTSTTTPTSDTQPPTDSRPIPTSRLLLPGEFGRQAFAAYMDPNNRNAFNIQLSPTNNPLNIDNVFAYNEAALARNDKDKDGQENRTEFNQIIQGLLKDPVEERRRGDNRFKAVDVNQNGLISPVEQAAMTLYELDFARRGRADTNMLTRESADFAFTMVQEKPDEVRAALDTIIKDRKLEAEYQRYQTELKRVQDNNARFDSANPTPQSSSTLPGEFGRRAALAVEGGQTNIQRDGVQVSDPKNPSLNDFFAFAENNISFMDGKRPGTKPDLRLSEEELGIGRTATGFDEKNPTLKFFRAVDANKQEGIDAVEYTMLLLAQEGVSHAGLRPEQIVPGRISNQGIQLLNQQIIQDPEAVRTLFAEQIKQQKLREAYVAYQQALEAAKNLQPASK